MCTRAKGKGQRGMLCSAQDTGKYEIGKKGGYVACSAWKSLEGNDGAKPTQVYREKRIESPEATKNRWKGGIG
jgi:hypothetical protein